LVACGSSNPSSDGGTQDGSSDGTLDLASEQVTDSRIDRSPDLASEEVSDTRGDAPLDLASESGDASVMTDASDAVGERPPEFASSRSCQLWAETFCDDFAQCASSRGVPGLFALRYSSREACIAGTSWLCRQDLDIFRPKTGGFVALSDPWGCRVARVATCDDVLGLAAPPDSCHLQPDCPVDGGAGYRLVQGTCGGTCTPFPEGASCPAKEKFCVEYGYACRTAFGGDGTVACRKVQLGGAGDACAAATDHDCLPGFVCQDKVCRAKLGPGAICGDKTPCNDQLGLACAPDPSAAGTQRCQVPAVVPVGGACGGTHGRCGDFSFCNGSTCVLSTTDVCPPTAAEPGCLPGLSCEYGNCKSLRENCE
jgi:hypothetical protein